MAVMTYKQWLEARSRRVGKPVMSTPAEAAAFKNWQAQQPEYKAQQQLDNALYGTDVPDPAAGGQSTALDPNDLWNAILKDPQALTEAASAQQDYTTGSANALAQWQNAKAQLTAQLPQFAHNLDLGIRQANQGVAASGAYQTGQGELNKQEARTNYANDVAQNQLQSQAADTAYQTQAGQLASDFNNRYYGSFKDAANRYVTNRLNDFDNTYGINSGQGAQVPTTASTTPPAPPTVSAPATNQAPPTMTYKQFLAKHPGQQSSDTLARKWDTRFNAGRRFA